MKATGQRYKQTAKFVHLDGAVTKNENVSIEINRRIRVASARLREYSSQLYDRSNTQLPMKIRLLQAEVMEAMLYGCATWTLRSEDFDTTRPAHYKLYCEWLDSAGKRQWAARLAQRYAQDNRLPVYRQDDLKRKLCVAGGLVRWA